jgi:hypothetical protein
MDYPPPAALKKFLRPYDKQVQDLALRLRALLLEEMAPCYENIYDAYSAVAIGYDDIFHIAVYSQHVNLGFNEGATLDDPKGILVGDGKRIRHISIKSVEDLKRPEIRSYIRRARKKSLAEAKKLGEVPKPKPPGVVSTVKAIYPKKRRPK